MTVALRHQREESTAQAERLQAQTDRLRTILIMTREIAGSLNTRYVVDSTVQAAVAVTDGRVLLWLIDEDGSGLELASDSERGAIPPSSLARVSRTLPSAARTVRSATSSSERSAA